ncbi:pyruvate, phosphate dikinase, partial [Candidatus Bathyarchaeota archaeon]|nr:pyruvate, phosphate dikinase [Candidatus Bathyarchaeota archaeon]
MQAFTYSCNLSEASLNPELNGAKSANLGKLINFGFPVPEGFVINTSAFKLFLKHNQLPNWINTQVLKIDFNDSNSINSLAEEIRHKILESELPQEIITEIKIRYSMIKSPVAIRSSATIEDLSSASSAGQMETNLNITSFEAIIDKVKNCFASLYSPRALAYRH